MYAHSTGEDPDGSKLERKLAFLEALAARMGAARAEGKQVVLCGDLNIAARGVDVPWRQCMLPVAELFDETEAGAAGRHAAALAPLHRTLGAEGLRELAAHFAPRPRVAMHELEKAMLSRGALPLCDEDAAAPEADAADAATDATAAATDADDDDEGAASEPSGAAPSGDGPSGGGPSGDEPSAPAELGKDSPPRLRLEALLKQLRIDLGQSNSNPRQLAWLNNLLEGGGGSGSGGGDGGGGGSGSGGDGGGGAGGGGGAPAMVDSFAAFRAHRGRATAWSQYTNGRYSNLGRRIDFFLVDRPLFEASALPGGPLVEDEDDRGTPLTPHTSGYTR